MSVLDRNARNHLAAETRRFLSGDISAFEFDEIIFDIQSEDRTVKDVVLRLWFHYDDCKDHRVALSKVEWNYIQRLLLILDSDCHIVSERRPAPWRVSQLVALTSLVSFMYCAWQLGFGKQLYVLSVPFGLVSIAISLCRDFSQAKPSISFLALSPFSSFAELWSVYRRTKGFSKACYRQELSRARVRSKWMYYLSLAPFGLAWLLMSPVVLFFQSFSERVCETRVVATSRIGD